VVRKFSLDLKNRIVAHRGLWSPEIVANSQNALVSALNNGFGVETDLRDGLGKLIVSHDIYVRGNESIDLGTFVSIFEDSRLHEEQLIALNVKSDGLADLDLDFLRDAIPNSFFFDMSIPELVRYKNRGLPYALRMSEFEPIFDVLNGFTEWKPAAYWVDGFESEWFLQDKNWNRLLSIAEMTPVVLVSPELHRRPPASVQEKFLQAVSESAHLYLCTDLGSEMSKLAY
jgi:hypothetical protein